MPHLDELLGIATFATAGWLVAIPLPPAANTVRADYSVTTAAAPSAAPADRTLSIEVIARRSVEPGRFEDEEKLARERRVKELRPDA